ncbi:MAG TPA: ComEA family DNA-binding protein [Polyangiales bacterium]|nr:ComEA family DNA-binding protein [Polyangiales bacterium]
MHSTPRSARGAPKLLRRAIRMLCIALTCSVLAHGAAAQDRAPPQGVVNLNSASAEELERLPGVGPSRARAILELRQRLAGFKRIEDLLRVKGIGRATFRKLRPLLTLDGPTTLSLREPRAHLNRPRVARSARGAARPGNSPLCASSASRVGPTGGAIQVSCGLYGRATSRCANLPGGVRCSRA